METMPYNKTVEYLENIDEVDSRVLKAHVKKTKKKVKRISGFKIKAGQVIPIIK